MSASQKLIINEYLTACLAQGRKYLPSTVHMHSIWWGSICYSAGNIWVPLYLSVVCFSIWGWARWQTISFQLSVYPSRDSFHMLFKVVCLHVSGLMFKHGCCLCWQCTVKAASVLHDKLFRRLLLSPMHFFDTTPLGRILTRFSRDMDEGKAWFVLTGNLSPKRVLSQWSHPGWQGVLLSFLPEGVAFCYPFH